jgi:hypothetical protein
VSNVDFVAWEGFVKASKGFESSTRTSELVRNFSTACSWLISRVSLLWIAAKTNFQDLFSLLEGVFPRYKTNSHKKLLSTKTFVQRWKVARFQYRGHCCSAQQANSQAIRCLEHRKSSEAKWFCQLSFNAPELRDPGHRIFLNLGAAGVQLYSPHILRKYTHLRSSERQAACGVQVTTFGLLSALRMISILRYR